MAEISKITLPSGTTYDIKDTTARSMASGGIQLKGTTTTALTDEATTNPITIDGESYTAVNQDAVFYGKKEFVFDGTMWHEFGDMSGLGALASKDSASGTVAVPKTYTTSVTPATTSKYVASSATGGGSVSAGTPASFTATVTGETLALGWTANTPTAVTLPNFSSQTIVTGVSSATTTTATTENKTVTVS